MEIRLVSCMEKIFTDGRGTDGPAPYLAALQGESIAFQCAILCPAGTYLWPRAESDIPGEITIRRVDAVPVKREREAENSDESDVCLVPGLYPDILTEIPKGVVCPGGQWQSLFIEIHVAANAKAGQYPLRLLLMNDAWQPLESVETAIEVIGRALPPQQMEHTEWFHSDCLADFYHVPAFSERHWEIIGHFMETAARRGCTMILTPHFTPALDTQVGGERTTVQLVDVEEKEGAYHFEFAKLKRWIDLAFEKGLKTIEFSHLFTQWGANAAPKIMGVKDGKYQRLFGWDTKAAEGEYPRFLAAYLPVLTEKIREWGIEKKCCFHISDEPSPLQLESYLAAKKVVLPFLSHFPIMDALSDLKLAQECHISPPIACVDHLDAFLQAGIAPLWGYYCCLPVRVYTNRFLYMSLARTRMMGMQWWKYDLKGFLHWGYNFYNSVQSIAPIHPCLDCESGGMLPAGDPFLVYPGMDGRPVESLRLIAMHYAMQDARALSLLAELKGREYALTLLEEDGPFTLQQYPHDSQGMQRIRRRINEAIKEA